VNEPPNLWQERVRALRERAPRVERSDKGDMWIFDGGKGKWPVGLTAVAGLSFFDYKPMGITYETMRPGSFDTKAGLADMDADGIYAQILYPSVTLKGAKIYSDDRELQTPACGPTTNGCSSSAAARGRLIGQAILPTTGSKTPSRSSSSRSSAATASGDLSMPSGGFEPKPEDDRFGRWPRRPASIAIQHRQLRARGSRAKGRELVAAAFVGMAALTKAGGQDPARRLRHPVLGHLPALQSSRSLVESNIGWIPTLLEQSDDMFMRYRWYTGAVNEQKEMPSAIFFRNFWATFMVDTVGMDLRHRMNLDHIMWSTDYPHSGSDWPNSRLTIERVFRDVPKAEVRKKLHSNSKQLNRLDQIPDRQTGR
jgi:hypothetical protein